MQVHRRQSPTTAVTVGAILVLIPSLLQSASVMARQAPEARIGEPAQAVSWRHFDPPQRGRGQDRAIRPGHPPPAEITPMTLPYPRSERSAPSEVMATGDFLIHDADRGETVRRSLPADPVRGAGDRKSVV